MPKAKGSNARETKPLARRMEPFEINGVSFKNRILRSSLGGQLAAADGAVTDTMTHFERRFALSGVAGLVSATISVSESIGAQTFDYWRTYTWVRSEPSDVEPKPPSAVGAVAPTLGSVCTTS